VTSFPSAFALLVSRQVTLTTQSDTRMHVTALTTPFFARTSFLIRFRVVYVSVSVVIVGFAGGVVFVAVVVGTLTLAGDDN
jgi:hypothetical protein